MKLQLFLPLMPTDLVETESELLSSSSASISDDDADYQLESVQTTFSYRRKATNRKVNGCSLSDCPSKKRVCKGHYVCEHYNLGVKAPQVAREWDYAQNQTANLGVPADYTPYSGKKVWWLCAANHSWLATINNRVTHHSGCPGCAKTKLAAKSRIQTKSVESRAPTKAVISKRPRKTSIRNKSIGRVKIDEREWDYAANLKLGFSQPQDYQTNCRVPVWWICRADHSHRWLSALNGDRRRHPCPICSRAQPDPNSLLVTHPQLAAEWHYQENLAAGLGTPASYSQGCATKVWWQCTKNSQHSWQANIHNRVQGCGCPMCASQQRKRVTHTDSSFKLSINFLLD